MNAARPFVSTANMSALRNSARAVAGIVVSAYQITISAELGHERDQITAVYLWVARGDKVDRRSIRIPLLAVARDSWIPRRADVHRGHLERRATGDGWGGQPHSAPRKPAFKDGSTDFFPALSDRSDACDALSGPTRTRRMAAKYSASSSRACIGRIWATY